MNLQSPRLKPRALIEGGTPIRLALKAGLRPHNVSVAPELQQLVNQRFRLVGRDGDVGAVAERAFAGVQDGFLFFQTLQIGAAPDSP